jgi:hypothetical protein
MVVASTKAEREYPIQTRIALSDPWIEIRDGDPSARTLYERHYSCHRYLDGRRPMKCIGPGEYMLLMTPDADALFAWRRFIDASGQSGVNCSIFRNEAPHKYLSSDLIREACRLAWRRWLAMRLYTYVNPRRVRSQNPGYCFLRAGWRRCGTTKGGLFVLECLP